MLPTAPAGKRRRRTKVHHAAMSYPLLPADPPKQPASGWRNPVSRVAWQLAPPGGDSGAWEDTWSTSSPWMAPREGPQARQLIEANRPVIDRLADHPPRRLIGLPERPAPCAPEASGLIIHTARSNCDHRAAQAFRPGAPNGGSARSTPIPAASSIIFGDPRCRPEGQIFVLATRATVSSRRSTRRSRRWPIWMARRSSGLTKRPRPGRSARLGLA